MRLSIIAPALAFCCICAALPAQTNSILGEWRDPSGSVLRIDHCGNNVCIWIAATGPNAPATDVNNPKESERRRSLCGLQIGQGFTIIDGTHAKGGSLYDPKSGNTYRGEMTLAGTELRLRGYIGISFFGRTEVWTRVGKEEATCATDKR
jgi:uncharacterized protein (DUF2147 family)